jgi:hypothetical protein
LWINICKYGMPDRESKEGFTKFIYFSNGWCIHKQLYAPIMHLFLWIY